MDTVNQDISENEKDIIAIKNNFGYEVKNEVLCWSLDGWFYGDQKTYEVCRMEYNKYFNIKK